MDHMTCMFISGVIAHGIGHFGFFVVHHWPHGSSCSTKCPKDDTRSSQSIIPSNGQLCSKKIRIGNYFFGLEDDIKTMQMLIRNKLNQF